MQITAKLLTILPIQSGTGKNGEWKKQDLVFVTTDQYPKKICISFWGDKLQGIFLNESEIYVIDFDIESREYNGKWFTEIRAWRIVQSQRNNNVTLSTNSSNVASDELHQSVQNDEDDVVLPF